MNTIQKKIRLLWDAIKYYSKGIFLRTKEEHISFLASGIAFNGVLCFVPLLLVFTSVLGIFISSSIISLQRFYEILDSSFPAQPYSIKIKELIHKVLDDVVRYKATLGIVGVGVLTWTGTSLFSAIRTVLNRIYRIKSRKLFILTVMEDVLWVIVTGLLFLITNVFLWFLSFLKSVVGESSFSDLLSLMESIPSLMTIGLIFIMYFVLYRFIPDQRLSSPVALVSACTTTSLWWLAGKLFGWYLSSFHSFKKLYGTYAFIFVVLVWIYYSSMVFVVGAIVGQLFKERESMYWRGS